MNDSSLLRTIRLGSKSQASYYSELVHIAEATLSLASQPLGCDPRWIADELDIQAIGVAHLPVRKGEPPRAARVRGNRMLFLDSDDRRWRGWHVAIGCSMHRLAHHPMLAHCMLAIGQLAALIALPDELIEMSDGALPEDIHSFIPVPIIEARIVACARSGLFVASLA